MGEGRSLVVRGGAQMAPRLTYLLPQTRAGPEALPEVRTPLLRTPDWDVGRGSWEDKAGAPLKHFAVISFFHRSWTQLAI